MFRIRNLLLLFVLFPFAVRNQTLQAGGKEISISDFRGIVTFLASGWMEGREAGEKGCFMAADYIASLMESYGLQPFGDSVNHENQFSGRSYFQNFTLFRFTTEESSLSWVNSDKGNDSEHLFAFRTDFSVEPVTNNVSVEYPVVFAGYGISLPEQGYDDYSDLDVENKIVVMLSGFPGSKDTASYAWQKIGKIIEQSDDYEFEKRKTAQAKGAVALIVISESEATGNSSEPEYEDYLLLPPEDTALFAIPVIDLHNEAAGILLEGSGIQLQEAEDRAASSLKTSSVLVRNGYCRISLQVKREHIGVNNVLGVIYGKDSTRQVIVGAHYDHLGKRDTLIYYGADDNASGTSGMLALAQFWADKNEKPPCNLVFAAWTAEEEGMLGSSYYTDHFRSTKNNTPLYLNLDMISRSDPTDTMRIILSVGTLKGSESMKDLVSAQNLIQEKPFQLDLWQSDENGDSDYTPFAKKEIPVMTFFSGFHDDYHTPRDVIQKVDFEKMKNVLNIVNGCINDHLAGLKGKE
jgi:hypothetical protein